MYIDDCGHCNNRNDVGLATKASVSRRSEEWIRFLILDCLDDYFGNNSNAKKSTNMGRKNVARGSNLMLEYK